MSTRLAGGHPGVYIDATALVEDGTTIGPGTKIWAHAQVRTGATIGRECVFGRNTFVDVDVTVGDRVKVQNNASLFAGVSVADGAFVGPHVVFTNDRVPRAVNADQSPKSADDWELGSTHLGKGASLGACVVVVAGVTIGAWAMAGSGAVITRDVPEHALVLGNPARIVGWVSAAGVRYGSQDEARIATERERADDGT